MFKDESRNLNPTKEAKIAMIIFGEQYAKQYGGSMDFWDRLTKVQKQTIKEIIKIVKEK